MACCASPEMWDRTRTTIQDLFRRLENIEKRGGNHIIMGWVKELRHELELLWEDLHIWDRNESVCWDEFWSRLRRIKKQIENLEKGVV